MASRFALFSLLAVVVAIAFGCSFSDPTKHIPDTTNPTPPPPGHEGDGEYVSGPWGTETGSSAYPLQNLGGDIGATINAASYYIGEFRIQGVKNLIDELVKTAPSNGVGGIKDDNIANPPPLSLFAQGGGNANPNDKEYAKYFACPIEAPDTGVDNTCFSVVQPVLVQTHANIDQQKDQIEQQVVKDNPKLTPKAIDFVVAWAMAALKHGATAAAIQAEAALRAEGKCDVNLGKWLVAHLVGYEQGINLLLNGAGDGGQAPAAWAKNQVEKACVAETDSVAIQAGKMAEQLVDKFVETHALCFGFDYAKDNKNLLKAEVERKKGLVEGIKVQVEILKTHLFKVRAKSSCDTGVCTAPDNTQLGQCFTDAPGNDFVNGAGDGTFHYPGGLAGIKAMDAQACCRYKQGYGGVVCVAKVGNDVSWCKAQLAGAPPAGDGPATAVTNICCGIKHLHVGSPLVLDLDDDGVRMTDRQVSFDLLSDGHPQQMRWVGAREAFLAVDLNGDGRIDRGSELFGDRTQCLGSRCYDGREALAQWDSPAHGGNGDGLIDKRDSIYSRLLLWTDRNSDGKSDPDELVSLDAAGVLAFNLQATYEPERLNGATVSSKLQVLTRDGFRNAYDVWFFMKVSRQNLAAMMPAR